MATEKQTLKHVSQEDFEKFGDNPQNHPDIAPLIAAAINSKSALDTSDIPVTNSDLLDEVTICGKKCHPITAGHIALFERVGNPLFDGTSVEVTNGDFMEVLYVLTNEDIPKMIDDSMDLKKWKKAVNVYAFTIKIEELRASIDQIEALIMESSEELAGEASDGEEDDSKKNTTG